MNYRELQAKCKAKGISAKGSKEVLMERLINAKETASEAPQAVVVEKVTKGKGFVFIGDSGQRQVTMYSRDSSGARVEVDGEYIIESFDPNNPESITMNFGVNVYDVDKTYTFMLNGPAVKVDDETAAKLRSNSHFVEQ